METQNSKDESVRRQLLALANMSRPELCEKWRDLYGNEPPNSSKEFLCRRLSYRVQELFYGGLDADLQVVLTSDAPKARPKKSVLRDGAKIFRDWHGTRYEVTVRGNKYEYNGTLYRSLSGVAKAITGVLWNGKTFFGITTE
ncbi:MAG: DUF2924 domain-containing protein [Lentisphaerae bacterium]|nr:DUF2924 domain-containing protein [Lentisphaerota bacterium]